VIKLSRTIAILTVGATLLAAGSAFAVKTMAPVTPAAASEAACPATASAPTAALTFDSRWNEMWRPVNNDLNRLAWVKCSSDWAFGYVSGLDLSTLPIMR
jgi:hypothetical protein